ncbi:MULTISPECIES: BglII/BstYI family type II restriction endonuclease [Dyella]|uniref:Restriction endonuclease n=2 Tax=Dyella TaxID=231454 RepID=A0A4R0YJ13_9GAMM|nr:MULTISPECIES: BglII/BstYI family type II restriction endonuclease [Dyella]TBR36468.1 restriction endonuclease [Dyella terrae]TCI08440.1 restriction endonuclease [Dyella soli]
MKLNHIYSHNNGDTEWRKRGLYDWVTGLFDLPAIRVASRCTSDIRQHVSKEFQAQTWAIDVKIDQELNLTTFAMKDDLAFQLQTGNISRAPYDLLKLQYLHQSKKIRAAALAVPTKAAAAKIGSNIANAERISKELAVFDRVITVPILLIAFD